MDRYEVSEIVMRCEFNILFVNFEFLYGDDFI